MERSDKLKEMLTIKPNSQPQHKVTHRVGTSGILDKVKAFLPQMNEANDKLVHMEKSEVAFDVDIEQQSSSSDEDSKIEKPIVKMNLALFQYDSNSCSSDDESSSLSSNSEHGEDSIEQKTKTKKFRLKMPTDKRNRSKDGPVQEVIDPKTMSTS